MLGAETAGEATETGAGDENYKKGGKDGRGLPSCGQGWVAGLGDGYTPDDGDGGCGGNERDGDGQNTISSDASDLAYGRGTILVGVQVFLHTERGA